MTPRQLSVIAELDALKRKEQLHLDAIAARAAGATQESWDKFHNELSKD